jgi:hypothetical protein
LSMAVLPASIDHQCCFHAGNLLAPRDHLIGLDLWRREYRINKRAVLKLPSLGDATAIGVGHARARPNVAATLIGVGLVFATSATTNPPSVPKAETAASNASASAA